MASKRAWGDKSGGGDPNILKLEDSTRIRLIDPTGKIEYRQHAIEHKEDTDQVIFVVCPDDGNCPLCRKPEGPDGEEYWSRYKRFATNVWDYATNSVKVLIAGPQVFNKFDDAAEVGHDPMASDWTIHKTGARKQTTYNTIRGDTSTFQHEVGPDDLHDLDKYTQPSSVEQILEEIEKMGYDYDALGVREFDVDSALAYVFPYGKLKGSTVEQVLATDQQYAEWMYSNKKGQGAYGDPLFLALHTVLESRGEVEPIPELDVTVGPPAKPAESASTEATSESSAKVELIKDESTVTVTIDQAPGLEAAGFERVAPPEPEPGEGELVDLNTPDGENVISVASDQVKGLEEVGFTPVEKAEPEPVDEHPGETQMELPDGTTTWIPDSAVEALESSGAKKVGAPDPEPEPEPIPDSLVVMVKIGESSLPMKFGAIVTAVEGGTEIVITDNDEAQAELLKRTGSAEQTTAEAQLHKDAASEANGGEPIESAEHQDPEKPFNCEFCEKAFKTKGALTQHKNREHKDAKPVGDGDSAPAPAASSSSGDEARDALLEEVKALIDQVPELQKDYDKLLDLFKEVAGKRAISEFSMDELGALKTKLEELVKTK